MLLSFEKPPILLLNYHVFDCMNVFIKNHQRIGGFLFLKNYFKLSRYFSASSAAIQPDPAEVIA